MSDASKAPTNDFDSQLIDQLGGPTKVADFVRQELGQEPPHYAPQAASMWKRRGIPAHIRPIIVVMAKASGVSIPDDFLLRTRSFSRRSAELSVPPPPSVDQGDIPSFLRGAD